MRSSRVLAAGIFAVTLLLPSARAGAATGWHSWDSGLQEAGATSRLVLVDVYTDWCGWCKRMDRDVYARRDVQDYLARKFVVVRLNAESSEIAHYQGRSLTSRALAAQFGVNGYPTTIFLSSTGSYLGNVPGYTAPGDFLQLLRYIGDGHMGRGESFEDFKRGSVGGVSSGTRPGRH
jgi:thioredoxin-related protein